MPATDGLARRLATALQDLAYDVVPGAGGADLVVVLSSRHADDLVTLAGTESLAGTIVLDLTQPRDLPELSVTSLEEVSQESLGERLQRALPSARVVKAINALDTDPLPRPTTLLEPGTVLLSGDDGAAKDVVQTVLTRLGHRHVVDLGDIATARGTERLVSRWWQLMSVYGARHRIGDSDDDRPRPCSRPDRLPPRRYDVTGSS
ncbi:hypothetical protein GCM10022263_39120 [Nocardioides daeguensis]|uniref:Uncharacterized protein n=1 Tax=Nocardioides daeguensis TaxID=908359 RepID=A0ABP6WCR4_9ACTN